MYKNVQHTAKYSGTDLTFLITSDIDSLIFQISAGSLYSKSAAGKTFLF